MLENRPGYSDQEAELIFDVLSCFPNKTRRSVAIIDRTSDHCYVTMRLADTLRTIQNRDNVFEIGSISKAFTSSLLAREVVENGFNPDTPVRTVLDFELREGIDFTSVQLVNHTSGLSRFTD